MDREIGVIGSSGWNAALWTRALRDAGFVVRTLSRHPDLVPDDPRRRVVAFDLADSATYPDALVGLETLCLVTPPGPDQAATEIALMTAATQAGVARIIKLSVLGADIAEPVSPFARSAREAEHALQASGIAFVILRANGFMQNVLLQRAAIAQGRFIQPKGTTAASYLDVTDIADVAVVAASGKLDGEILELTGPKALSADEMRAALAAATGRPIALAELDATALRQMWSAGGMPGWRIEALTELNANVAAGRAPHLSRVTDTVRRVLGREATAFDAFAARSFAGPG